MTTLDACWVILAFLAVFVGMLALYRLGRRQKLSELPPWR
jgi:membrane protein DedA with SNARE-associated domain